jgi:hypothetical protein
MAAKSQWNTSEAFELLPEASPKRAARRRIRRVVRKKPVYIYTPSGKRHISVATMLTLALIFAGALAVSLSFSSFYMEAGRVASLQDELSARREINSSLRKQAEGGADLDSLRKAAESLGMSEPKPYQVFRVEVPAGSYAVSSAIPGDKPKNLPDQPQQEAPAEDAKQDSEAQGEKPLEEAPPVLEEGETGAALGSE